MVSIQKGIRLFLTFLVIDHFDVFIDSKLLILSFGLRMCTVIVMHPVKIF